MPQTPRPPVGSSRESSPRSGAPTAMPGPATTSGSPPGSRSGSGSQPLRGRPWNLDPIRAVLDGTEDPTILAGTDRKGMTAAQFAILKAATTADDLRALLALLDPPERQEASQIDRLLTLMEATAEAVVRIEQRLQRVESRLAAPSGASRER